MNEKFLEKKLKALEKPPIKDGEVFNPDEEVKDIRWTIKDDQRKELANFKEKLAYQKEGLARIQELLLSKIRENSGIKFEELHKLIEIYGKQYGFTDELKEISDEILQKYIERRNRIKEVREKYTNNRDLFNALFGRFPEGDVEVSQEMMSLVFYCDNIRDFAYVFSLKCGGRP